MQPVPQQIMFLIQELMQYIQNVNKKIKKTMNIAQKLSTSHRLLQLNYNITVDLTAYLY